MLASCRCSPYTQGILSCSVRRNICYGLEEEDGVATEEQPSQEDIEDAAKKANAHDFITALPQGYDMASILVSITAIVTIVAGIAISRVLVPGAVLCKYFQDLNTMQK